MKKFLTKIQIDYIRNASKSGKSLNSISSDLNISKTTIYWWYRKFNGRKIKPIEIDRSNQEVLGEIIGAFCGDGNFLFVKNTYHYRICFALGENEYNYAKFLSDLLKKVFGRKAFIFHNKKGHCYYVVIIGKEIYKFLLENLKWEKDKTFSIRLKRKYKEYDLEFLKGFVRGLFDTDGYVTKKGVIGISIISKNTILQTSFILKLFGIEHFYNVMKQKVPRRDLYTIRIKTQYREKFMKYIGSSNSYKLKQLEGISNLMVGFQLPIKAENS